MSAGITSSAVTVPIDEEAALLSAMIVSLRRSLDFGGDRSERALRSAYDDCKMLEKIVALEHRPLQTRLFAFIVIAIAAAEFEKPINQENLDHIIKIATAWRDGLKSDTPAGAAS